VAATKIKNQILMSSGSCRGSIQTEFAHVVQKISFVRYQISFSLYTEYIAVRLSILSTIPRGHPGQTVLTSFDRAAVNKSSGMAYDCRARH